MDSMESMGSMLGALNRLLSYSEDEVRDIFFYLIRVGNNEVLGSMLALGIHPDLECRNGRGMTPLLAAVATDNVRFTKTLLGKGVNIEAKQAIGMTALHLAAAKGNVAILEVLLEAGADVNSRDNEMSTPMHVATLINQWEAVACLLDHGADPDAVEPGKTTALHHAAGTGNDALARKLIGAGASVFIESQSGNTVLHTACHYDSVTVVAAILETLASRGQHDIIYQVLRVSSPDQMTPLTVAVSRGRADIVKLLVDSGAPLGTKDRYGFSPLHAAVDLGHLQILRFLIMAGANIESNNALQSPLATAAAAGREDVARLLLQSGAMSTVKNTLGLTPMLLATINGHLGMVKLLHEQYKVDLQDCSYDGWAPIHVAVHRKHFHLIEYLLDHGVDADLETHDGVTPLMLSCEVQCIEAAEMLVKHLSSKESDTSWCLKHDDQGRTALHVAAEGCSAALVQLLLDHGADLNEKDAKGRTPLYTAELKYNLDVSNLLNELGAQSFDAGQTWSQIALQELRSGQKSATATPPSWFIDPALIQYENTAGLYQTTRSNVRSATWLGAPVLVFAVHVPTDPRLPGAASSLSASKLQSTLAERDALAQYLRFMDLESTLAERDTLVQYLRFMDPQAQALLKSTILNDSMYMASASRIIEQHGLHPGLQPYAFLGVSARVEFAEEVDTWFPLNHPHVVKLFGACHLSVQLLLIAERVRGDNLWVHLEKHPDDKWKLLYETALGLQYLHEQGIVHGHVLGENILVGEDGAAKIGGMTASSRVKFGTAADDSPYSDPFEVILDMRLRSATDVYSLGMCIIRAVTGEHPYALEEREYAARVGTYNQQERFDITNRKLAGIQPRQPPGVGDREWELVTRMTAQSPARRLPMLDVIRELEALALQEAQAKSWSTHLSSPQTREAIDLVALKEAILESSVGVVKEQRA